MRKLPNVWTGWDQIWYMSADSSGNGHRLKTISPLDTTRGDFGGFRGSKIQKSGKSTKRLDRLAPNLVHVLRSEPGRSTLNVLYYKYKYFPSRKYLSTSTLLFWGNVLKYIPSSFKMYLSTIRSTFQLPSNFLYPENQTKFLT